MPKPKKALRSFRCSDVFWAAIEAAVEKQGISCNEFINLAVARALKDPIVGEAVDLEKIAELANADAVQSIAKELERTNKIFAETTKLLIKK